MRKSRMNKVTKRRGPSPRGPYQDKRANIATRVTHQTRTALEEAADASGRSLSQEIELRLERSFERERTLQETLELRFGRQTATLLFLMGREIGSRVRGADIQRTGVPRDAHSDWVDEPEAFAAARAGIEKIMVWLDPRPIDGDLPSGQSWLYSIERRGVNDIGGYGQALRDGFGEATTERIITRMNRGESEVSGK